MAQAGFFMYQRWNEAAVGVFGTQAAAQQAAIDGEYVIVPIEANRVYTNMIDETLPGAIVFQADGFETRLTALETQADNIQAELDTTQSQAQTKFSQVDSRLDGHDTTLTDLETRVATLEGA